MRSRCFWSRRASSVPKHSFADQSTGRMFCRKRRPAARMRKGTASVAPCGIKTVGAGGGDDWGPIGESTGTWDFLGYGSGSGVMRQSNMLGSWFTAQRAAGFARHWVGHWVPRKLDGVPLVPQCSCSQQHERQLAEAALACWKRQRQAAGSYRRSLRRHGRPKCQQLAHHGRWSLWSLP